MASLMDDIMARYQQRQTQMQGQYPSEREMRRFAPPVGGPLPTPALPPSPFGTIGQMFLPPANQMNSAIPVRPMDSTLFGEDVGPRPVPMRVMDSTLAGYDMPVPPARPAYSGYGGQDSPRERVAMAAPGAPMQLASAAPSVRESFMQRLLSGPNYQSNSMPVMPQGATTPQQINFGNPDNPADFVRADRALMGLPEEALRVAGLLG